MHGCLFVWRKSTEEWLLCCTLGTVKTGETSHTIWGCMTRDAVGPLAIVNGSVIDAKYRHILQKHFLPLVAERQRSGKVTIFQDGKEPVHRAISKIWPPRKTLSDLQAVIREEWEKIPIVILQNLIE